MYTSVDCKGTDPLVCHYTRQTSEKKSDSFLSDCNEDGTRRTLGFSRTSGQCVLPAPRGQSSMENVTYKNSALIPARSYVILRSRFTFFFLNRMYKKELNRITSHSKVTSFNIRASMISLSSSGH